MTFQSILYLLFLTLMWFISAALRRPSANQIALLAASYVFYASWGPALLLVLLASSIFNYIWGTLLRRQPGIGLLWGGLAVNIFLLASFKYVGWALAMVGVTDSPLLSVVAPLGLSFYTFQAMSYLLDVYRGGAETKPSLLEFLLYMAFWPTVLAGPICRVDELVPQFRRMEKPNLEDISIGCMRILYGLFMKVVLADMLGFGLTASEGVDTGFDSLSGGWSGIDVWFLAIGFGFQLFFDFAGYSHVAIGSARLFGIRLRENFDDPYLSKTPTEFWTRWHMSLSSWIRDYLFFPLAIMRREVWWRNLALIISMTVFGIWHGAGITFLLWGAYHGSLLVCHRVIQHVCRVNSTVAAKGARKFVQSGVTLVSWGSTFAFISLGWVLFRANSLSQAGAMLGAVLTPSNYFHLSLRLNFYILVFLVVVGYFVSVGLRALFRRAEDFPILVRLSWLASPVLYSMMIIAVIIWSRQASTFVYMQF